MKSSGILIAAGLYLTLLASPVGAAPLAPLGVALPPALGGMVEPVAWPCPPGYHIGRGGRRCWPNGWAPAEEIPLGYIPRGPRVEPMPPVLECPPGYHLGRGLQRCWPN